MILEIRTTLLWTKLSYIKQALLLSKLKKRELGRFIRQYFMAEGLSSIELIRNVRNWINVNSIHLIDSEHNGYAFKTHRVLKLLWQHHANRGGRPHLSCGPRSYAMKEVLRILGIEARIIDIFELDNQTVNAHTLLEVFCPERSRWILQDPDFNVEFKDKLTNGLLAAESMLAKQGSKVFFDSNGFEIDNITNCRNTLSDCFNVCILYRHSYEGKKSKALIRNAHFLDHLVESEGDIISFSEYLARRGPNPKIDILDLEPWQ